MSYAGDLSPQEAWAKLEAGAILVDVRTEGEWAHIGIPDTASAGESRNDPLFIQWNLAGGVPNPHFVEQLRRRPRRTPPSNWCSCAAPAPGRSPPRPPRRHAGYTSYNVLEGFEGETDRFGERTVNGWKNRGLPTNLGKNSK